MGLLTLGLENDGSAENDTRWALWQSQQRQSQLRKSGRCASDPSSFRRLQSGNLQMERALLASKSGLMCSERV